MSRTIQNHDPGGKVRLAWPADSTIDVVFSYCGKYRYQLREIWNVDKPLVFWLLMNPSVACSENSDRTLRKTGKFSRFWGYGGQLVGNVHAYRATEKKRLLKVDDPVGPENDKHIMKMAKQAALIVLAFGRPPSHVLCHRGQQFRNRLSWHHNLCYLRLAEDGTPWHPLYLSADLFPQHYDATREWLPPAGGANA